MTVDSNRVGADSARTLSKLFTSLNQEDRHEFAGLFALMHVGTVSRRDILFRPGVAISVSLHFLINKGFVAAGLVSQFGIAYGILTCYR